ncbi:MAG: response regulator transcription factor [Sphingobacteriales bacterium]|nr:response regulator transcription factor [Sphingobacteriales bacterium]
MNEIFLTRRELEIIEEISNGLIDKEIASKIYISPGTVKKHIQNIYKKLGVRNRVEASMKYQFELKIQAA